jgi:hypothetical protein
LTLLLRGKTDAADRCVFVFGNCLNKKEIITFGTFLLMQSVLDNHSKKEQESWKNNGKPGFESL